MSRVRSSERHYQGGKDDVFGYACEMIVGGFNTIVVLGGRTRSAVYDGLVRRWKTAIGAGIPSCYWHCTVGW